MAIYPSSPVPSEVHPSEIIDPALVFSTDYGYTVRRVRSSRPRRRWQLDYLGKSTAEMRVIRNFLYSTRNGVLDFQWFHPTAIEVATFVQSTPVSVFLTHGLATGMSVAVNNTPNPFINGNTYTVTVTTDATLYLDGTIGFGIQGTGLLSNYVPHAIAVMAENTFPAPSTIIGPERIPLPPDVYRGYYNFSVTIEEQF